MLDLNVARKDLETYMVMQRQSLNRAALPPDDSSHASLFDHEWVISMRTAALRIQSSTRICFEGKCSID